MTVAAAPILGTRARGRRRGRKGRRPGGAARAAPAVRWLERRVGLTLSGVAVLVVAGLGYVLGHAIQNPTIYLLVYGLVIGVVGLYALGRRQLSVEAERSQLPSRVRVGQSVEVTLELRAKRRLSTIVVEEELPPGLGQSVLVPVPVLPAGAQVSHPYAFVPNLRGRYAVGPMMATWSDPFGLTHRRQLIRKPTEIIVHPDTEAAQDRVLSREWEDPPIRPPQSKPWATGFEFYGMRDYVPGDDPRRIVWRKVAQTFDPETGEARYLVRESEQGITDRVSILFDTHPSAHSPGTPSETFETAVRVVASLGVRHLKDGFSVSLFTNGAGRPLRLRGPSARLTLLDTLAVVQPERSRLTDLLEGLLVDQRRDTHMLLVTPYLDQGAAVRIKLLLQRGVSLSVLLVVTDDPAEESVHRAGSLGCSVVEVTSHTRLDKLLLKLMALQ